MSIDKDKQVLIVDMDEVLYEEWSSRAYCEFKSIPFSKDHRQTHLIQDLFTDKEERDKFVEFCFSKQNYYDGAQLIKGARSAMQKLNEKYSLYICTDYLFKGYEWSSDKALQFKTDVLRRDFPFINPSQYIFMRGKHLLHADILIDDRPWNFGPHIDRCLLFTAMHNKHISQEELRELGLKRVNTWKEIEELLL